MVFSDNAIDTILGSWVGHEDVLSFVQARAQSKCQKPGPCVVG